jgi:hypothetical protein
VPAEDHLTARPSLARRPRSISFRAFDPEPERIRARSSDREEAWGDDRVGVVLDTFNDKRRPEIG